MKCKHDPYWTGCYGTCMICRAEKAESELAAAQSRIVELLDCNDRLKRQVSEAVVDLDAARARIAELEALHAKCPLPAFDENCKLTAAGEAALLAAKEGT